MKIRSMCKNLLALKSMPYVNQHFKQIGSYISNYNVMNLVDVE